MAQWNELSREYEARRYPPTRRLDVHADGPGGARETALRWIQTFAHEQPGAELLIVVDRTSRRGRVGPVRAAVEALLRELDGGLLDGWAPFGEGSLALRISMDPRRHRPAPPVELRDEGRTAETAGAAYLDPEADIPEDVLPLARRAAELRRDREGLAVSLAPVVLRELWLQAQVDAMENRRTWADALRDILAEEERQAYGED